MEGSSNGLVFSFQRDKMYSHDRVSWTKMASTL